MSAPGTYALLLRLDTRWTVEVGALGAVDFPPGWYLYLGSARGPGGLAARVARHRRVADKRVHWHIDYVRPATTLIEVWISPGKVHQECAWAAAAGRLIGADIIAPRFGASDCRCPSHLFHYAHRPQQSDFESLIETELEGQHVGHCDR